MVFVGYSDSTKGYRCLDPTTNEVITSRDVIFLETKPANIEEIEDVQSILTDSLSNEEDNENEEDPNDASNVPERMVTQPTEVHDERNVPERNVRRSSPTGSGRKSQLIVAIYVDDLLIFWKDINDRDNLKKTLSEAFHMKDMGKAKHCIGLNITYDEEIKAISLDQSKYIKEILATFGMAACKPAATPSDPSQRLSVRMCNTDEVIENVPYQEAVGSLLYLAQGTRPDIAHAVNDVSRFNSNHGKAHWQAVKRIFRYLKGTVNLKLRYDSNKELIGYSDADWASDVDKRRSCTGYVFAMSGGAISWSTEKKYGIPKSTLEFKIKHPGHKDTLRPSPVLTTEEECALVRWIQETASKGFPRKANDLKTANPRPHKFKNNKPGDSWLKGFLKRHPGISKRTSEGVSSASACVLEQDIRKWFTDIAN
ncbi:Tc5 transposase DNA-binding domain [Popillia japonica]|uniref:Tc5 transposase DNA-binding domain n=1 Tax=Popillia japonica TaxID=7064 RepID=A0AAW1HX00_POPJA